MDVSGIGSSTLASLSSDVLAQMRANRGGDSGEFAGSFVSDKDGDGDGLLSLEEAGIGQTRFDNADTDGDGYLTEEEISADMESRKKEMDRMMGGLNMLMQGMGGRGEGDFASSLISESDADGNGMLSQEESGLSDELFGALDADGDGSVSTEEINAAMRPPDGMTGAQGAEQSGETIAAAATASGVSGSGGSESSGGTESASSSDDDEEYDEYDLNEDGVVTMDELRQAFANGDVSLESLFETDGAGRGQDEGAGGNDGQSALMRMAMRAYEAQGVETGSLAQGAVA
ncbi:CREC-EF hand family protein [Paucidesulfovibrio longus]|uniref:EF-hand domain-containing protein n=1 Tax=Paucidesulfovibrio longus TaxID=889 RepID=UPI0003B6E05B|nr:EF-hand domain-containing protein [Paucidesulfovibrio longus]